MQLSITLLCVLATRALCTTIETECGVLDVKNIPEGTDLTALKSCQEHPISLGISSSLENPNETPENLESSIGKRSSDDGLTKRNSCPRGRGNGPDYDYGCDKGWCWRNCNKPPGVWDTPKPWCWLKYEGGNGGWTPCGRWQDCEWSYNNKNAKCAKGNCKSCGCGC